MKDGYMKGVRTLKKIASILLAAAMALTLGGVTAFAATTDFTVDYVMADGSEGSFDLDAGSINAMLNQEAGTQFTITLNQNATASLVLPAGSSYVLNLNGHKLTNEEGKHTITNNGTLTVQGAGTVDNVSHGRAALYNAPTGKADLQGGLFTRSKEAGTYEPYSNGGNSFYTLQNQGIMTIGAGVEVKADGGYSSLVANGYQDASKKDPAAVEPQLTINGGTFSGGVNTVKNDEVGVLTINDGTFDNYVQHSLQNWNKGTVNGGHFVANNTPALYNGTWGDNAVGDLSVKGGAFEAGTADIFMKNENSAPAKVSGGAFSAPVPADHIVTGSTAASLTSGNDATYYIGTAEDVAKTLTDKAKQGDTIAVQQGDVELAKIADGVTVKNEGEGKVTVAGTTVEQGQSTVTKPEATPAPTEQPTATPTVTPIPDLPQTGEHSTALPMMLFLAGAGVVVASLALRKRHA